MNDQSFSLVLPCYNESKSLARLVDRAVSCARQRQLSPEDFRLVLVENGSADDSLSKMNQLQNGPNGEFLEIVRVNPNRGYGNGVHQGLISTKTTYVGWSHADEQCDPEDAFLAWEIAKKNDSVLVKGTRHGRALKEWLFTRCFEFLILIILGRRITEVNAQPKVFHRRLLDCITTPPLDFAFDLYVLVRAREAGLDVQTIDVVFPPRVYGQSNWAASFRSRARTIGRMIRFMLDYRKKQRTLHASAVALER